MVSTVVIHSTKQACASDQNGEFLVNGPYCSKPIISTGAGDHFNAGFMLGSMLDLSLEEALLLGTANSGYYVRNAFSATKEELCQFIINWSKNL